MCGIVGYVGNREATEVLGRLVFVTDAAMNIAPDLVTKADIILNAVHLAGMFSSVEQRIESRRHLVWNEISHSGKL